MNGKLLKKYGPKLIGIMLPALLVTSYRSQSKAAKEYNYKIPDYSEWVEVWSGHSVRQIIATTARDFANQTAC